MFLFAVFEAVPDNAYAVFDHTGRICILATLSADLEIFYYTEYDERKVSSALSSAAGRKKAKYEIGNMRATKKLINNCLFVLVRISVPLFLSSVSYPVFIRRREAILHFEDIIPMITRITMFGEQRSATDNFLVSLIISNSRYLIFHYVFTCLISYNLSVS